MSKELLEQIKNSARGSESAEPEKKEENNTASQPKGPVENSKPVKEKVPPATNQALPKKKVGKEKDLNTELTGFEELYEILKQEKEDFTFNKRVVYIDDDLADILELLKKEAKINSNLLASHLLKKFFQENIGFIKVLKERKRGNKFLD